MIKTDDHNGVRVITLNRPQVLNAFNNALFDALAETVLAADADDNVRVAIITGEGRAFSAGADLVSDRSNQTKYGFGGLVEIIIDFSKPLIVAANGLGVGFGATICGLVDMTYLAESARLRCPFSALGLTAEAASTFTFPQLMGRQQANRFLLGAQWLTPQEAVAQGLALAVLPNDELMPHVLAEAAQLAQLPLVSLRSTKKLIMDPLRDQLKASATAENAALAQLRGGPANVEAVTAFKEKREPNFSKAN